MSLSSEIFGRSSFIHKLTNVLGLGIPGWLDRKFGTQPPDAQVNSIGDISSQTAKEGDPRVIVWGRVRAIGGNLIHCQEPVKRWILSYAEQQGGKGGNKKKQKVYTEHIYRTYALGICEGPISGITRIWKNGALVYDARGNYWGAQNNHVFMADAKIYLGGWDQMPCPDLQAIWGEVPAYRGTAYIVFVDQDLTETRGAIPQYQFEVERAEGVYLTSKPYAVESVEDVYALKYSARVAPHPVPRPEEITSGIYSIQSATLREPLITYSDGLPESIDAGVYSIQSATLREALITYSDGLPESVSSGVYMVQSAILRDALIGYSEWPDEGVNAQDYTIIGATLT